MTSKISAERSKANNSANNVLHVKNRKYISVTRTTEDIEVTELAGKKFNSEWYAGFKATELPVVSVEATLKKDPTQDNEILRPKAAEKAAVFLFIWNMRPVFSIVKIILLIS